MRKIFLGLLMVVTCWVFTNAKTISIDATKTGVSSQGSGYNTTIESFSFDGISFGINQIIPTTGQIRVNNTGNGAFTFYNETALPGITEVRITTDKNTVGTMYMQIGDAIISGVVSATDNIKGSTSSTSPYVTTFAVPEGETADYFKIQLTAKGSGTVKASTFEIDYAGGGTQLEKTEMPVISGEESFTDQTTVTITAEEGAKIYYTTTGMYPTVHEDNLYTGPFVVNSTCTVVALAITEGKTQSDFAKREFTKVKVMEGKWALVENASEIEVDARYILGYNGFAISNAAVSSNKLQSTPGTVEGNLYIPENMDAVMIFTLKAGATDSTYYLSSSNYNGKTVPYYLKCSGAASTNVSMESSRSTSCQVKINFLGETTDVAIRGASTDITKRYLMANSAAIPVFGHYSPNSSGYHRIQMYKEVLEKAETPVITLSATEVNAGEDVSVTISAQEGLTIRYTTNGNAPTKSSGTVYSEPFTLSKLSKNTTIKAVAYADDKKLSDVASATVNVNVVMPETPVVTYTATIDGTPLPTENEGTYTAINGTTITITSANATVIEVNEEEYTADNGVFTFTTNVDDVFCVKGVNPGGESEEYWFQILVDYEASSVPEFHTLSLLQKDRDDKTKNAPVKYTGWAFVTGHYNIEGRGEQVWIEDHDGNACAIFDDANGDLASTTIALERSTQIRNFYVRSAKMTGDRFAMQLIAWPEHTAEHVQVCDFPEIELHNSIGSHNEYKCVRFKGNITFSTTGGTMTLENGNVVNIANKISVKNSTSAAPLLKAEGDNSFNWQPGQAWPEAGTTLNGIHIAGFVMPTEEGTHELYPAHVTENEGDITGVGGIEKDQTEVYIENGTIMAPAGSRIFNTNGAAVRNGSTVANGIYIIVLPNGGTMKLQVR